MYVCMCMHVCDCTDSMYVHVCDCTVCMSLCIFMCMCARLLETDRIYVCIGARFIYSQIYYDICTYIHTYIHTYIPMNISFSSNTGWLPLAASKGKSGTVSVTGKLTPPLHIHSNLRTHLQHVCMYVHTYKVYIISMCMFV